MPRGPLAQLRLYIGGQRERHPGSKRWRRRSLTLVVASLGVAAAGCGGGAASSATTTTTSAAASQAATINVGTPPIADAGALYAAQSLGDFTKENLKVNIKFETSGPAIAAAIQGGSLQLGLSALLSIIQGSARGVPFGCVSGVLKKPTKVPELSIMATAKSGITSVKQLAGSTLAINVLGGANQLLADEALSEAGVDPSSVHLIAVNFPTMVPEMKSGQLPAAITDEPFTEQALEAGMKVVDAAPANAIAPKAAFSCWVTTNSWYAGHKDVAKRFIKALNLATQYMVDNPTYIRTLIPKYTKTSTAIAKKEALPIITQNLAAKTLDAWMSAGLKFTLVPHSIDVKKLLLSGNITNAPATANNSVG